VALCALPLLAQDEVRVTSPDGQIEFRIGTASPSRPTRTRLPDHYRGKPVLETSFMGFDVLNQEPMLGEKVA